MPILLIILLAILIAQVGFWDGFVAVIGAAAMIVLFIIILVVALGIVVYIAVRRMGRR